MAVFSERARLSRRQETGKEAFELRLWDGRIGRWLTTDPKKAGVSPYWGMNNNPVSVVDPDGGEGDDWIKNNGTGEIKWFNGTGDYAMELAENYWGKDSNMSVLSTEYFDPNVFRMIGAQKIEKMELELFMKKLEISSKIYDFVDKVLPDGAEAQYTLSGGQGLSSNFTHSVFLDSDFNTANGYSFGAGPSIGTGGFYSANAGVNLFWAKDEHRSIHYSQFSGQENTYTIDIPIVIFTIPTSLGVNYIDSRDYWGLGFNFGTPNAGASVSRSQTFIAPKNKLKNVI